jgi:hypothetical protein
VSIIEESMVLRPLKRRVVRSQGAGYRSDAERQSRNDGPIFHIIHCRNFEQFNAPTSNFLTALLLQVQGQPGHHVVFVSPSLGASGRESKLFRKP